MPTDDALIDPDTQIPHPVIAGDPTDDDAAILDRLVESRAQPPTPDREPVTPISKTPLPHKPMTRLMTTTLAIDKAWLPTLILPADPNRVSLQMWAASDTATDFVRISDDPGKVQSLGGCAQVYSGQWLQFPFPGTHNGPLWAYAPDGTGPIKLHVIAVTE
jgi:hypothetical protein